MPKLSHLFLFLVTPVPPSLSFLCTHLCGAISSILLQRILVDSPEVAHFDSDSNINFFLAEHAQLVTSGAAHADDFTPTVLSALNYLRDFEREISIRISTFKRPHLSCVLSSVFAQFLLFCQQPLTLEKHALLLVRSMDICAKSLVGSCGVDPAIKTDVSAHTFTHEEIAASSNYVKNITSSSSSAATRFLLSNDWGEMWTSEGSQGTHWICVELAHGICAKDVGICVQSDDGSWCPKVITVRAAETLDLLKAKPKVTLDYSSRVSRGGRHYLKALDDNLGKSFIHFASILFRVTLVLRCVLAVR